ncbi:Na(+)-translocating NADH-quinone reductase subunit A [Primorskyibacter flagellatus]|uniref:Na(+)-translocating NADH-quinone reductase subunit A n=1 Tax=Primorskyibacter flagellatus TaxID=1387277 RepID=UPI003A932146
MFDRLFTAGLRLPAVAMPAPENSPIVLTEEAAITADRNEVLRVEPLVDEDTLVAQGQPLLRLRANPAIALVAPMAGRVARIELAPGRRLLRLVVFREGEGRQDHAHSPQDEAALRALMQGAGMWRILRSRPFGRMPTISERPAAIFVMATDTRPGAPDPQLALKGREDDFAVGLEALQRLIAGQVWLCEGKVGDLPVPVGVRRIPCGALHPQGLPGIQIHRHHPARMDAPVWDVHAEDVADLGSLLATGLVPDTRLVSVTGAALREPRLLRCQPGADLRGLAHGFVRPGPHRLLSGSALDGQQAHWLAPRDRQVTVLLGAASADHRHWFGAALRRAARPMPVIPTAALEQAMGSDIPAHALIRTLASGDPEGAARLGALSLLEEDLALADYVTGAVPRISAQLRAVLDVIATEEAAP